MERDPGETYGFAGSCNIYQNMNSYKWFRKT